ncbi:hypothetical protein DEO72_LG8g2197 [Vigna unguiculata]|nr:hypothetical protein DEO72_LG8g2197 [Vigna unguiculata]
MVARRRRRSNGARTISSMVKWQRSDGVGGTIMQRRNGVARRRRRCSGGHEQPPPRCSRRCNDGEAGTNDWGAVEKEEEKICDAVWRMLGEEKNRRRFALLRKDLGFFIILRSHTASVNSKLRHIVFLYASVGRRTEA